MNSNMTFPAPLPALAFLGMVAFLMLSMALAIGFAFARKSKALKASVSFALIALLVYGAMLLLFSVASQRVLLASGQEKYFCELDCHLAYSVVTAGYQPDPQVPGDTRSPTRCSQSLLDGHIEEQRLFVYDAEGGVIDMFGFDKDANPLENRQLYSQVS